MIVRANDLSEGQALFLFEQQKLYSAAQAEMAKASPHLAWVLPKSRTLPKRRREEILQRDDFTCVYCDDTSGPFEVDHIVPHSRGGSDEDDNLCTACQSCNRSKGAKTPEEWLT